MERKVSLLDTVDERGDVLKEFRQRCMQFVKTSVDWAPDTVHSHLQEYMNEITKESFTFHMGVALATECVQTFSAAPGGDSFIGGGGSGGSMSSSSARQPLQFGSKSDSSRFMISMSNRQSYTSTVSAMLAMCESRESRLRSFAADLDAAAALVARLDRRRRAAANADPDPDDHGEQTVKYGGRFSAGSSNPKAVAMKSFHETVWKITAALILIKPGIDEKLVFTVTRAPLKLFNAATMKVVVECWNWLLSARPDLEMKFLQEMIAAWHSSATARLGIFHVEDDRHSPLAPDEEMKENLRPRNPESEPHDIWIRFIQERIEVAKYCSHEQIIMFTHMLQRTLDIAVGRKDRPAMSRHAAAAGTRFRLLNCGMSLLQGEVLQKTMAKNTLRQRIYSTALDYFCAEKSYPTQSGSAVAEDVQAMLKFWTTMHQDKKYIKTSTIGDMEGGLAAPDTVSMANGPSAGGMTAAPSTIMSSSGAIIGGAGSSALDARSISSEFHNR